MLSFIPPSIPPFISHTLEIGIFCLHLKILLWQHKVGEGRDEGEIEKISPSLNCLFIRCLERKRER
jgi:hypothetical protein